MAKRNHQFQTIRTEGALLPPDILRRIASLKVDGATPDAYHLPPGTKLNESISQSWTALLKHWQVFRDDHAGLGANGETGTAVTNERWLLPLFNELGYGRLVTTKSPVIGERSYAIERFYNHTPIHLIGCKLPLDRRTKGARGAATASPHSMVQEYLNCSDEHIWALLSNGLQLRILRDNVSLSRQTFVEFDLEAMMEGEVYPDFALLWLLCHQSRVESDKPEECWLEKWSKLARDQGTRVLNDLRVGVQRAIEALGRGFIAHPQNDHLRKKLQVGSLAKDEFYRQLLRIVYRLLFLFVAEDRELLHPLDIPKNARDLYDDHYSTRRLRELALRMRGTKHADLWHSLSLVFASLGKNEGCPQLGLCGLGSFLWRSSSTADLLGPNQANGESAFITNDDLLQAIRALAYVEQDRVLRIVDYRNLGSEELGSVYESLLELHPVLDVEGKSFSLITAAGNERKTTGSYYTPDSLVQCLLDSALDPVVEDRLKGKKGEEAEQAILDIKVCDPASGSGHFLIAAAHRLARHLARIRTGESEPSPEDYQHALRDVIGRSLYGVDINPMAVELCKVSLWMEAIEPGKPLSFLDHHIQCGNSLLGTTPALLAKGIPDNAFQSIEGDDKSVCSDLKKSNKREREDYASGQGYLFSTPIKLGDFPATLAKLNKADDDTLSDISAKESMYAELVKGADYRNAQLLADTWCAVFVWKKDKSGLGRLCPTERIFRSIEENPLSMNIHVRSEVERLSQQYRLFHWHLAFPDVFRPPAEGKAENEQTGWNDGFNVVLGNPPWEKMQTEETQYFASLAPEIAALSGAKRKKAIADLTESDPTLAGTWAEHKRFDGASVAFIRNAQVLFPLTGKGKFNTSALFAETNYNILRYNGRAGCVVPTGIATDDVTSDFFRAIVDSNALISLYDFENRNGIFSGVHRSFRFCLLTLSRSTAAMEQSADYAFFTHNVDQLRDASHRFILSPKDIAAINPNSRTAPLFRTRMDAVLTHLIHTRIPILVRETHPVSNPWETPMHRMLNMTDDSHLFRTSDQLRSDGFNVVNGFWTDGSRQYVRLFEAKMIHHFDHRWSMRSEELQNASDLAPENLAAARYHVPMTEVVEYARNHQWRYKWFIGWRDITNTTNERTVISMIIPWAAIGNTVYLMFPDGPTPREQAALVANLSAFVLDFGGRQKLGGTHLTFTYMRQMPVLAPDRYGAAVGWDRGSLIEWLFPRVLELTYTAWDLESFAQDCGYDGPPFRWDEERRFLLRCELDAAYFHLYLGPPDEWETDGSELVEMFPAPRDAVDYIMETFPIVKRKDIARTELKGDAGLVVQVGRYFTKDTILEIYDEMADAIRTGQPYQTRLNPPPGPPVDAADNFIPMAQWDPNNWPSHIHPPRETVAPADWPIAAEAAADDLMAEVSYPTTERDRLMCAAALSVIEQGGSLPSMDHLDALLFVTHPVWCKAFLDQPSHSRFDAALTGIPDVLISDSEESIGWKQCRDYLEQRKALSVEHNKTKQPISAGSDLKAVKQSLPGGIDEAVGFALKALQAMHMLRQEMAKANTVQRQIINSFDNEHRALQLVA